MLNGFGGACYEIFFPTLLADSCGDITEDIELLFVAIIQFNEFLLDFTPTK